MEEGTVLTRADLDEPDGTPDVSRQVAFDDEDVLVIQSRVAGGVTTGWHHNGDRLVYGYVVRGHAELEYGPGRNEPVALDAGDFISVPPRTGSTVPVEGSISIGSVDESEYVVAIPRKVSDDDRA